MLSVWSDDTSLADAVIDLKIGVVLEESIERKQDFYVSLTLVSASAKVKSATEEVNSPLIDPYIAVDDLDDTQQTDDLDEIKQIVD